LLPLYFVLTRKFCVLSRSASRLDCHEQPCVDLCSFLEFRPGALFSLSIYDLERAPSDISVCLLPLSTFPLSFQTVGGVPPNSSTIRLATFPFVKGYFDSLTPLVPSAGGPHSDGRELPCMVVLFRGAFPSFPPMAEAISLFSFPVYASFESAQMMVGPGRPIYFHNVAPPSRIVNSPCLLSLKTCGRPLLVRALSPLGELSSFWERKNSTRAAFILPNRIVWPGHGLKGPADVPISLATCLVFL